MLDLRQTGRRVAKALKKDHPSPLVTLVVFVLAGTLFVLMIRAAVVGVAVETENGSTTSGAKVITDSNAAGGKGIQFGAPTPPPPPPPSGCAGTAQVKTFANFTDYLNQPGDQVIDVPDGTYRAGGSGGATHGSTNGACKGWLVLRAKDQGQVVLDLSGGSGLTINGSRIMLVGFKTIKGSVITRGSDITLWYNELTFYQNSHSTDSPDTRTAEMNSYGYDSNHLNSARLIYHFGDRLRILGSNLHNGCSGEADTVNNNTTDVTVQGTNISDIGPVLGINCHANAFGDEPSQQGAVKILDSNLQGLQVGAAENTQADARGLEIEAGNSSSSLTVQNVWVHDFVLGIHTNGSYVGTCSFNNIYAWNNVGGGSSTNNWFFESGNNCKVNSTMHSSTPPGGSTSPDKVWQAANTYNTWPNWLY